MLKFTLNSNLGKIFEKNVVNQFHHELWRVCFNQKYVISLRVYQPPLPHPPNPLLKLVSSKNCWICHWESKRNALISHWQQHLLLFFADNQIIAQTYKNLLAQAKFHGQSIIQHCVTPVKRKNTSISLTPNFISSCSYFLKT